MEEHGVYRSSLSARKGTSLTCIGCLAEYGCGPAFTEYAAKIAVDFAGVQQEEEGFGRLSATEG